MEFEENNEEFEGKRTRNLKEKHREFFTRGFYSAFQLLLKRCYLVLISNFEQD
jgi:hypothetical protein